MAADDLWMPQAAEHLAALETAVPGVGANARELMESSQAPTEAVLATLLNDLHAVLPDPDVDGLGLGGDIGSQLRSASFGEQLDAKRRPRGDGQAV